VRPQKSPVSQHTGALHTHTHNHLPLSDHVCAVKFSAERKHMDSFSWIRKYLKFQIRCCQVFGLGLPPNSEEQEGRYQVIKQVCCGIISQQENIQK